MSELNVRDSEVIDFLLSRRSMLANLMTGPGPTDDELRQIVGAGIRVPDHGRLFPWRMLVLRGGAREKLGDVIADTFRRANPDVGEARVERERGRLLRAPVVVAVVSKLRRETKIPEWEQVLSAGAVCQTMLIAAQSMGFAAQWLTEWYAYDPVVQGALGLGDGDRIAGFLYIGNGEPVDDRMRPDYTDVVTEWAGAYAPRAQAGAVSQSGQPRRRSATTAASN